MAPLLVALGAGIALLWIDRPTNPDADTRQSQEAQSAQPVQSAGGASGDAPSAGAEQATPREKPLKVGRDEPEP